MSKRILAILLFNIILFCVILLSFENKSYQLYSIISQVVTLGIAYLLNIYKKTDSKNGLTLENNTSTLFAFIIIVSNAGIGIANIIYTVDLIDFSQEDLGFNVKNLIIYSSSASIIFSQIGGFFIQLYLTYFLSVIIGFELRVKEVFIILGTAYLGFFTVTVISLLLNIVSLDYFTSVDEFNKIMLASDLRIVLGKFGEYMTMNIAIYMLVKYKNLPFLKSILLMYLPNILLLWSMLLFKTLLQ